MGVGIGQVLINFPEKYDIYGLDIEKDYVDFCKRNIPRGKFFFISMHDFRIDERFDVIFSVDDSINFLKTFAQWKSTFKSVSDHLNENGLFVFDMYTPKMLKVYSTKILKELEKETTERKVSIGYYYDKAIIKNNTLTWDVKIFEKLQSGLYQLNEYTFKERIHPVSKVKSALSSRFEILETTSMEDGRKILFVCRKKHTSMNEGELEKEE